MSGVELTRSWSSFALGASPGRVSVPPLYQSSHLVNHRPAATLSPFAACGGIAA